MIFKLEVVAAATAVVMNFASMATVSASVEGSTTTTTATTPTTRNGMEDEDSFSSITAFLLAIVSLIIYVMFLRPTTAPAATAAAAAQHRNATTTTTNTINRTTATANNNNAIATPRRRGTNNNNTFAFGGGVGDANSQRQGIVVNSQQQLQQKFRLSEAALEILQGNCMSKPIHVNTSIEKTGLGGCNILADDIGLVNFSHTTAAAVAAAAAATTTTTTGGGDDTTKLLRQDRAKLLSRILTSSSSSSSTTTTITNPSPPPSKGSTIVISLSPERIEEIFKDENSSSDTSPTSTLARSLYVLATYYNVLVILSIPSSSSHLLQTYGTTSATATSTSTTSTTLKDDPNAFKWNFANKLYNNNNNSNSAPSLSLSPQILPLHRILVSSMITGRVALVRQLSRVELVIDYDSEVQSQLQRFGYKVAVYSM